MNLPKAVDQLVGELSKLPGVGRRSAERLALHLAVGPSERLQSLADALHAGQLGVAQAHALAKARAHPRCGDELSVSLEHLLNQAMTLPFVEFKTKVETWVATHDMDGADRDAAACHARRDAYFHIYDGEFHGKVQGGALSGVGMKDILDRFVDAEFDKDWAWTVEHHGDAATPSLMPRSAPQRRSMPSKRSSRPPYPPQKAPNPPNRSST